MNQADARRIVIDAWRRVHGRDPTPLEASYTQAIAWGENQYGRAGQFARFASEGAFNWGSLHARGTPPNCPPGSIEGVDVRPTCFLAFRDDVSAAAAFVRVLTKQRPAVLVAMEGSPEDVATAMRLPPAYYEGPPGTEKQKVQAYANLIRGSLEAVRSGAPVPSIPSRGGSSFPWLLALGALGAGGYLYYRDPGVFSELADRALGLSHDVARGATRALRRMRRI